MNGFKSNAQNAWPAGSIQCWAICDSVTGGSAVWLRAGSAAKEQVWVWTLQILAPSLKSWVTSTGDLTSLKLSVLACNEGSKKHPPIGGWCAH